ncbi:uncharacterized protein [Macrobrachium rosenbergii]|uniref:uncharacterized protein n=1 Tax=Macrobrachium rosenbergii TaxID=79674 RepID=UPI0034D67485
MDVTLCQKFQDSITSHGIKSVHSTPYHPEIQAIIERFHQSLTTTLSRLQHKSGGTWEENLPYTLFAICHNPSETTGYNPFELLYAHLTRGPIDIPHEAWTEPSKADWIRELPEIQNKLKATVAQATERVRLWFDKEATTGIFSMWD